MSENRHIAIIDFGSQTTMLIARRIREMGVLAKIVQPSISADDLRSHRPEALILSGGPKTLLDDRAIRPDPGIFELGIPMLGICYGMQLLAERFGGSVDRTRSKEFGHRTIAITGTSELFFEVTGPLKVFMSHSDQVKLGSSGFASIANSSSCPHVAIECREKKIYGLQFHPEVSHSEYGEQILRNFVEKIVGAKKCFDLHDHLSSKISQIKEQVGSDDVIMGLSGGVDSSVAAVIIHRAIGEKLHCIYVNHGLHRSGEISEVRSLFKEILKMDLHVIDAREQFMAALKGVVDPETKRKKIGHTFIDVFEKEAKRFRHAKWLAQGTLYPDVIESECKDQGPSHVIKSHHNVGGLPERMNMKLLEPLRDLFKDEVRKLGRILELPAHVIERQPFPGPGLAVRIAGEVTEERIKTLKEADAIVRQEIENSHLVNELWQWFAILLPIRSVGVKGDDRSYGETIVIRCVKSIDAMTADWAHLPSEILANMSSRITNEVEGISRVLYDITQKPPGTIEWE